VATPRHFGALHPDSGPFRCDPTRRKRNRPNATQSPERTVKPEPASHSLTRAPLVEPRSASTHSSPTGQLRVMPRHRQIFQYQIAVGVMADHERCPIDSREDQPQRARRLRGDSADEEPGHQLLASQIINQFGELDRTPGAQCQVQAPGERLVLQAVFDRSVPVRFGARVRVCVGETRSGTGLGQRPPWTNHTLAAAPIRCSPRRGPGAASSSRRLIGAGGRPQNRANCQGRLNGGGRSVSASFSVVVCAGLWASAAVC
jgi:hypothetical protein